MDTKGFSMWCMKNTLYKSARDKYHYFNKIYEDCLKIKDQEILIITDTGYEGRQLAPLAARCYQVAGKEKGLKVNVVAQEPKLKGSAASDEVIKALDKLPNGSVVVVVMSNKLGGLDGLGKSFRKFIKERKHRFVSTLSIGDLKTERFNDFIEPFDIDYDELQERCKKVKEILDKGNEIHVTTEIGTDFFYNIKGKTAISNSGNYGFNGAGGNIPCGEVYIAPKGREGVHGMVVIDGTLSTAKGSRLIKEPVSLQIDSDSVRTIEDHEEAELLRETLDWAEHKAKFPWGIRRIGELGIGMNKKAKLVGATIIDEKCYNTAHVAIGSNYWFGGTIYAIIHLDQVFKNPKIEVDGEELIIS